MDRDNRNMSVLRISYRNVQRCLTNFNHFTTVGDIIDSFIDTLSDEEDLSVNDCCLCLEYHSSSFVLKPSDFIEDILHRYSRVSDIRLKLESRRHSSSTRLAQRQKLSSFLDPFEQLKIQDQLIQKQQDIITHLTRSHSRVRFRLSTVTHPIPSPPPPSTSTSMIKVKSILKNSSSVDRDIDQLLALESLSDDDHSITDSCLGSESEDSGCYSVTRPLETFV